jgi:SAM-dependent methyltransferase
MDHSDHVALLKLGVVSRGGVWADLGSGWGAFTLALADLTGPDSVIYSVDRDRSALRQQQHALSSRFPLVTLHQILADFTSPLALPPLDGLVMANSLHFVDRARQEAAVLQAHDLLRPGGRLILVEYDTDRGNIWVPNPLSFGSWQALAARAGFVHTEHLASVPSHFLGSIYSALSW